MSPEMISMQAYENLLARIAWLEERLATARREGYAAGVEAAARVALRGNCCTAEGPCANDACQTRWEVHDAIRALDAGDAP